MAHPADQYGSQGSVPFDPSVAPTGATDAKMTEQATPADMGAAIGAGVSKVGEAATNLANEYGGMVNNTLANNADSNLAQQIGKIKGDYMSKTGMDAYNSYGSYQAAIEQAYQDNNKGLTLGAQQAYMQQSRRMVDMHLADGSGYAASQLKEASIYSDTQNNSVYQKMALDPNFAKDPAKMGYLEGTVRHLTGSAIDSSHLPGLKTDPDTGQVGFDESKPEGQQLKAQYQQNLDANISQLKLNQFTTLARPDVMGAIPTYDLFKQVKDSLPPQAQVGIESYLKPRVFQAEVTDGTNSVINEAKQAHAQMLYNPQSQNTSGISQAIHQQESGGKPHDYQIQPDTFKQYAKPGESFNNPTDQDAVYGRIMDDLQKSYPNDPARQAVAYFSGKGNVAPADSPTPYLKDTHDKNGKTVSSYVADIGNRLGDTTTQTKTELASYNTTQPAPKYGTNANGAPLTEADYYQTHSGDVLARWHEIAQQNWPGDLAHEKAGEASLRQYMQTAIANQTAQERQDKGALLNAALGTGAPNQKPITSTDQLISDPKMRDLYYKVFERDPKFIETLNNQIITAQSRGENKDSKEYGDKIYDYQKRLTLPDGDPNKLTDPHEVMTGVGNGLTIAGSEYLLKKLKKDPDELKQENAALETGKSMLNITKNNNAEWPSALKAINTLDNSLQAKGIPASERYSGIDNKNSVLHALDPIIAHQQSAAAVSEALSRLDTEAPSGWNPFNKPEGLILFNDFKTGKYEKDKVGGEKALRQAAIDGTLSDQVIKDLAIAHGYAAAPKQESQ